jgi:ribosomal protein L24
MTAEFTELIGLVLDDWQAQDLAAGFMCYSLGMTTKTGDKVTIKRGKLSGTEGEVFAFQENPPAYVLKLADGTFVVQNVSNVKAPTEATITQDELAAILGSAMSVDGAVYPSDLIHSIDAKYPGFANRISWPVDPDAE